MVSVHGLTVAARTEASFSCMEEQGPCIQGGLQKWRSRNTLLSSGAETGGDELWGGTGAHPPNQPRGSWNLLHFQKHPCIIHNIFSLLNKAHIQCLDFPPFLLIAFRTPGLPCWKPLDDSLYYRICLHGGLGALGCSAEKERLRNCSSLVGEIQGGLKPGESAVQASRVIWLQSALTWHLRAQLGQLLHQRKWNDHKGAWRNDCGDNFQHDLVWGLSCTWQVRLAQWHLTFQGLGRPHGTQTWENAHDTYSIEFK